MSNLTFPRRAATTPALRCLRLAAVAATLVVALAGGVGSALARGDNGGGAPGGGNGPGGNSGSPSAVIVYGTPGNCPPTVACGATRYPPHVHRILDRRIDCGDFDYASPGWRRCMRRR